MDGWWDCDALDEMCCRAIRARLEERVALNPHTALAFSASLLFNLQSRNRAGVVAKRHYDVGNDFFECMLDPAMQYSCAWFRETDDLAQAQREKMDLICRKLGLTRGCHFWTSAADGVASPGTRPEHYGCRVVGITISEKQRSYAAESCRGLPVEIRLQDYRDLTERFDRIVSVGMLEHVGAKNYRRYMRTVFRSLRDGGVFLCQSIAGNWHEPLHGPLDHPLYLSQFHVAFGRAGGQAAERLFVLEDVQNLGADYEKTLMAWERNFARSWHRFEARYGERFYRMWRFYLLSCAGAFRARGLQVYQFLFSKGTTRYLPARTSWLYPERVAHAVPRFRQSFRVGKKCGRSARMPENDVFVRAEIPSRNEIQQRPERPSRINGIKQDAFALCHKPNRLAFQIAHDAIARAEVVRIENDIGGAVTRLQSEQLGGLAG